MYLCFQKKDYLVAIIHVENFRIILYKQYYTVNAIVNLVVRLAAVYIANCSAKCLCSDTVPLKEAKTCPYSKRDQSKASLYFSAVYLGNLSPK